MIFLQSEARSWYFVTSCNMSSKFCVSNEKIVIFRFLRFTRTLTRIYENLSRYLPEKSCNFWSKVDGAFKLGYFISQMINLKVTNYWGSSKIFSMCKTAYAEVGAILHHPSSPGSKMKIIEYIIINSFEQKNIYHIW